MKRLLSTLFTIFFSSLALADESNTIAAAPSTDISIAYLGQIFGTVGNVLHGTSGDMLGQMFYKFNQGVFVVAGMFVAYTTTTMVLRSAAEGSFMGPDKKAGWFTILRIPLGLALLIPIPATGYETYQSVVMEAVVQGVNLADSTWSWALDYLNAGGVVYMPPAQSAANAGYTGGGDTSSNPNYASQLALAQSILANATCMEISNVKNSMAPPPPSGQQDPNAFVSYAYQIDPTNYSINYPGFNNTPGEPTTPATAQCGSVSWNLVLHGASSGICDPSNSDPNAPMECSLAQAAVQQVVADLTEVAKEYSCYYTAGGQNSSYCTQYVEGGGSAGNTSYININTLNQTGASAVLNAMVDYQNLLMPIGNLSNASATAAYRAFISQAKNDGWIMAGRYYWDISLLNDQYSNAANNLPTPAPSPVQTNDPDVASAQKAITATSSDGNLAGDVQAAFNQFYGVQSRNSAQSQVNPNINGQGGAGPYELLDAFLQFWVQPLVNILSQFQTAALNPIIFVHQLGVNLLSFAGGLWLSMMTTIFAVYIAANICAAELPIGQAVSGAFDWLKPILLIVISAVFGIGLVLAYYVPLYPYIIFTFGTVGWFIAVIEAMVAAPLVCFGLTHPEGHDFLGRAEQALMLLLGVFLRPVLMILGLVAAMILSYVALLLLNTGYGEIIVSLYGNVGTDVGQPMLAPLTAVNMAANAQFYQTGTVAGKLVLSIVITPALLAIFTMLVYTIVQQCYSLIFILPDNILTWVGGPKTDSHAAQYAQQIESTVQGMGRGAGDSMGQHAFSTSDTGRNVANALKKNKDDDANNGNPKPGGGGSGGGGGGAAGGGGGAAGGGGGAAGGAGGTAEAAAPAAAGVPGAG